MNWHGLSTRLRTTHKHIVDNVLSQHTASQYRLYRKAKTFHRFIKLAPGTLMRPGKYLDSVYNRILNKKLRSCVLKEPKETNIALRVYYALMRQACLWIC